ncbi:MAG: HAD family hydrolase [Arcobacter sp.]|nr:HAD family hydrolase [Arcobacter sp.]
MNNAKKKGIIFDLDGTLINSIIDIAICANKVLKKFNLPQHEIKDYKKFVGSGADVLIQNCTPKDTDESLLLSLLEQFKTIYSQNMYSNTKPYDGIYKLLDSLTNDNYQVGILSNKPHEFTIKSVNEFFSNYNINQIHGQKTNVPKKPDPKGAIHIAEAFNINCENIYFIGDSDIDIITAKNAGMIAVGVSWGFRDVEELKRFGADFIVEKPLDIYDLVQQ